jgi:hypothetical protein
MAEPTPARLEGIEFIIAFVAGLITSPKPIEISNWTSREIE